MSQLGKEYTPQTYEKEIYQAWEEAGAFQPRAGIGKFSIVIPPPNVTGVLHMGHALNNSLQDLLIRYHRMQGEAVLWLPGTDHAGIATQAVLEKRLAKDGKTRHDLGREKFVEEIWDFVGKHKHIIVEQLKRIGASCDWERERFTLDEGLSRCVRLVFKKLYDKGLIYRGNYIINLCPATRSALSDEEVEYKEVSGHLWYIRYPVKDGEKLGIPHVVVATTRPETMLGDVAVAINPNDGRYSKLLGQKVILPLVNRELVVIADDFVDPAFGTGIVKVTPSHDPNDFEMGKRHNLPGILVMHSDGTMNQNAIHFQGLDRFECRKKLVKELEEQGFLEKITPHKLRAGFNSRNGVLVEPYQSTQWFVKMKPLAEPAIAAVKDGSLRFHPKRWTKVYLHWLENIRDWCISRQLWWGHRIPVWYCRDCGHMDVHAEENPAACEKCGSARYEQDEDVLDTWFSSWLWPFSTMGWPEKSADMQAFYPTDVLVTGADIIFFWVARMIMAGLEFTGELPFTDVYLHGIIRDADNRKMSKSLGNIVDPFDVIEGRFSKIFAHVKDVKDRPYGADALRMSLILCTAQGQDIQLSLDRLEIGGSFANKLWNAARLVLGHLDGYKPGLPAKKDLTHTSRWILTRLQQVIREVEKGIKAYKFNMAASALYNFFWFEFCDWYLELAKPGLWGQKGDQARLQTQQVTVYVLEKAMRLLHPIMPFITEEIWQQLPGNEGKLLILQEWPKAERKLTFAEDVKGFAFVFELVRTIRNLRTANTLSPAARLPLLVSCPDDLRQERITLLTEELMLLAGLSSLTASQNITPPSFCAAAYVDGCDLYIPLEGLVDVAAERARLEGALRKAEKEIDLFLKKLSNPRFVGNAPAEVVAGDRAKLTGYQEEQARLRNALANLPR